MEIYIKLFTFSLRLFTDLFHASLMALTLSLRAPSLSVPAQILCLSICPIAFPMPEFFTTDFVTGKFVIFVNK